jgi:hypothetical protein
MDPGIRARLHRLLDRCEGGLPEKAQRERADSRVREAFLAEFRSAREQIIRPCMEEVRAALEARGHRCQVTDWEASTWPAGVVEQVSITFRVGPIGFSVSTPPDRSAGLSLTADAMSRRIRVELGAPPDREGRPGVCAELSLADITPDVVTEQLLTALERNLLPQAGCH